jgi:hypothetical protein
VIALFFLAERKQITQTQVHEPKRLRKCLAVGRTFPGLGVLGVSFVQAAQYYVFGSVEFFLVVTCRML